MGEFVNGPPPAATGAELDELERWIHDEGLRVDHESTMPRWDGAPLRLSEAVDWMLLAHRDLPGDELERARG